MKKPHSEKDSGHKQKNRPDHDDDDESIEDAILSALINELLDGPGFFTSINNSTKSTLARIKGSSDPQYKDIQVRELGSPDLPFFRIDCNYNHMRQDIEAFSGRLEAGYGPLGLDYRRMHFDEDSPDDTMKISYAHVLYRFSCSPVFELDYGLGMVSLEGEKRNSGLSFTMPVNICAHPKISIRFVPTWNFINKNTLSNYDASIAYVFKYYSLRLGYEKFLSNGEVIQGPYAGFSIHF